MHQDAIPQQESADTPKREIKLRHNALYANWALWPYFVSPSIGYIRFLHKRIFLNAYFNYSEGEIPDVLGSQFNNQKKNISANRRASLFAVGPEFIFYTWEGENTKTRVFFGFLVGYYAAATNLKPGNKGTNAPEPPPAVTGSGAWHGFAQGINVGFYIARTDALFFLLSFGVVFGQTRYIAYTVVNPDDTTERWLYENYFSHYSFTPQVTVAIGVAF